MSKQKPIFVATHPRACSTAFERVFMTRRDILKTVHEPFGDAWYFGPERLAERYADDEDVREASGFAKSTYQTIMERINEDNTEGKRIFIKDMAQYFFPQSHPQPALAPSLLTRRRGVGTEGLEPDQAMDDWARRSSVGSFVFRDDDERKASVDATNNDNDAYGSMPHLRRESSAVDPASFKTVARFFKHVRAGAKLADADAPYPTVVEGENPTVVPKNLLKQFHYAFLIRHPRYSIPSYYRCCIPPLDDMTGFHNYRPDEAGYVELRAFFDYCRSAGFVGPELAGEGNKIVNGAIGTNGEHAEQETNGTNGASGTNRSARSNPEICLIDADDLLDNPDGIMKAFCKSVGIEWDDSMLHWESDADHEFAVDAFEKWKGFHEDAINSNNLTARGEHRIKSDEELYANWVEKYGETGAQVIKASVDENLEHYLYLREFRLRV